mgnify:CR=1 FL=1
MADHPDRHTCGRCGNMFYKLTNEGKRMPVPKQNKPGAAAEKDKGGKKEAPKKEAAGKKKKWFWRLKQHMFYLDVILIQ